MMLTLHEPLGSRQASAPLRIGGAPAEVIVPGSPEPAASIGPEGSQWWLRPLNDSVLLNGVTLRDPVALSDADVVQVGNAQLVFEAAGPALRVIHLAGNATVAPLHQDVLPGEAVSAGAAEITAAVEAVADRSAAAARAPRARGRMAWIVAPLGVLALVALLMLFRLVTVPVQVSPAAARIEVPGWFNWRSGERLYLMPGSHRLHASAAGYASHDIDVDAEAAAGAGKPVQVSLVLLPGEVAVDTGSVAGELLVDGELLGAVPGVLRVPAGDHQIIIRAPRHVDHAAALHVEGAGRRQALQVKLLPAYGWLLLDTSPTGALVRVDDRELGRAPLRVELDAGLRRLALNAPGRRGWNSQVAIQSGQTLDLGVIDLAAPAPAVAAATAPVSAQPAASEASAPAQPAAPAPPPPPAARVQSPLVGGLVLLPAGSFMEGSDRREQGRRSNEEIGRAHV